MFVCRKHAVLTKLADKMILHCSHKRWVLLLRPWTFTKMTNWQGVTIAKTLFAQNTVFTTLLFVEPKACSLNSSLSSCYLI